MWQEGTKPGSGPIASCPFPLCHPKAYIWWDPPRLVGFKPGKGPCDLKVGGFYAAPFGDAFTWKDVGCVAGARLGRGSLRMEKAPITNMEPGLKTRLGQQRGGVKPGFAGNLSLSSLLASLHREGINPPESIAKLPAAPSPWPVPLQNARVLVLSLGLGPSYPPRLFHSRSCLPGGLRPSLPAPGRIRLP